MDPSSPTPDVLPDFRLPAPRTAAAASLLLLVASTMLGASLGPSPASGAAAPVPRRIVVVVPPAAVAAPVAPAAPTTRTTDEPPATDAVPALPEPEPAADDGAASPAAEVPAELPPAAPGPDTDTTTGGDDAPAMPVAAPRLPKIAHVWVVVLGRAGFDRAFGAAPASPYLAGELRARGALLPHFHAVAHGGLPAGIALLTGQGPTPETITGCPEPADLTPGTIPADDPYGQARGHGCRYPATVPSLIGRLSTNALTFKAYFEQADPANACRTPGPRNPLAFLHEVADDPSCTSIAAPLGQLTNDVADPASTPALSYVVLQDDLAAAEPALRRTVDAITASAAYKKDGLVVVLPDEGEAGDDAAPSFDHAYPDLEQLTGGGRTGALLLSPFVTPGATVAQAYDQFGLLKSIEELLSLDGHLGFAADPLRRAFGPKVFGAYDPRVQ